MAQAAAESEVSAMYKVTLFHITGHVVVDGITAEEARQIATTMKDPKATALQINSSRAGSNSTTIINLRLVTNVSIEPPLIDDSI